MNRLDDLLAAQPATAPALGSVEGPALTYGELLELSRSTRTQLRDAGVDPQDRIAIVVPNGPLAATSFVTLANSAATAPLNPAYTAQELRFYLNDIRARLVVIEPESPPAVREVATDLGMPIATLEPDVRGNGAFTLALEEIGPASDRGSPGSEDQALVLHTSGTTSRPKMVPLSHRNLLASATNVASSLGLGPDDRCLNIMPLFHIHGLVAAVLASLAAGSQVVCTPGFNALRFFGWLQKIRPTWYTAVPTMHQTILARAGRNSEVIRDSRLRFVRSSSASLPPPVMADLEATFSAPVVEAYGMTEAAHQMASNPLPPGERKPGAVGPAAGPEIAIMTACGDLLESGEVGEVVIRGENVTDGYLDNPQANAEAFHGDWFRTGDQGLLDDDGYLRLTGRLKEIINRGGEKISPREVDEVLLDHPDVVQAVTFALPHPTLGEEVAAAIILVPDSEASDKEIRQFARQQLADFKVPRRLVFLDEIPKGPTGKLQRIGLAEKLGLV